MHKGSQGWNFEELLHLKCTSITSDRPIMGGMVTFKMKISTTYV